MTMKREPKRIWRYWLIAAASFLVCFGLALLVLPALTRQVFSYLIFGSTSATDRFGPEASHYISFVYGVLGATIIGWGTALLFAIRGPFSEGRREGWLMIAVPILAWFVLDSGLSLSAGHPANALLNAALLLLFAPPLVATFRHFFKDPAK